MKDLIARVMPRFLLDALKEIKFKVEARREIRRWAAAGKPVPPPSYYKNTVIRDFQRRYGVNTFIETGTFLGNTTEIQRRRFKKIYSIELSEDLYRRASKRFLPYDEVQILQGNSADVLPGLMKGIQEPVLFWLDAHYSGILGGEATSRAAKDCPIYEEIDAIFADSQQHVILIDDARDFSGSNGYPTLDQLKAYVKSKRSDFTIGVENDIIRILPGSAQKEAR